MNSDLADVLRDFLDESRENLDQVDIDLVELEKDPDAREIIARIFRTVHTIKGTCGFLGFSTLESVTHAGESVLAALRDNTLQMTPLLTSALLQLADAVRDMLTQIEATGTESAVDYSALTAHLMELYRAHPAVPQPARSPVPAPERAPSAPAAAALPSQPLAGQPTPEASPLGSAVPAMRPSPEPPRLSPAPPPRPSPEPPRPAPRADSAEPPHAAPVAAASAQPRAPQARPPEPATVAAATPAANAGRAPAPDASGETSKSDTSIRVDVGLLDKLMNLVGELVLARNQIIQSRGASGDATFQGAKQRLNLITSELQEGVMKTRMQPIGTIWNKFPRVVRDLAASCGKRVRLEMEGEQTELDRTLIEAIKDPLTHLVRNAVDHGIEKPEARVAAGKPAEGCLRLRAFHEGGQVNIEITDDGGGLNSDRIRQKGIDNGIISPDQASRMSERELFQLIFLPGFSTAAAVTNVSGRGVGMDVVRTNIERIGGTIDLQSTRGAGTTMILKIPLTLAIIRGVIVTSGDNRYVIPQASVLKLIRLEGADALRQIEMVHGAPVYRLMGKLLPLVRLSSVLSEPSTGDDDVANIVVLKADHRQFGVIVDSVQDTEEIVVKPLGKHLKVMSMFAGATIMGDGLVSLILDVIGLAQRAQVVSGADTRGRGDHQEVRQAAEEKRQTLLIVRSPGDGRIAIPLARVERLEEFPRTVLEHAGSEQLMQYRGEIMSVLDLRSVLVERRSPARLERAESIVPEKKTDTVSVVVCVRPGGNVGVIVDQIIDIVEEALGQPRPPGRAGMLGSVVIQGRVTELLDVDAVLRCAGPNPVSLPPRAMEAQA
jgi:two-component system, chemotaxis family, sensor kinase CheA